MCSFEECRFLTAIAVFAALVAGSPAPFAQSFDQGLGQIPAATVQPESYAAGQSYQPTSEEVGDALMMRQRYQAAIEAYKKAPQDSPDVWNKMGIAHQMMFNLEDATRCYKASLKLNPKNAHALNNLGTLYDSLKQYAEGERMYRKAIKVEPGSAISHKNLGTNLLTQHKFTQGWESYQAALGIDPHIFENGTSPRVDNPGSSQDRGAMNYYMARGCVRAGQNQQAIDYLSRALNEGFANPKKIVADGEFAALRGVPAFVRLLAAQGTP